MDAESEKEASAESGEMKLNPSTLPEDERFGLDEAHSALLDAVILTLPSSPVVERWPRKGGGTEAMLRSSQDPETNQALKTTYTSLKEALDQALQNQPSSGK